MLMKKYLIASALMFALLAMLILAAQGVSLRSADTPASSPKIAKVSLTCGATMDTPVATNTWQASFRYETTRARLYWKHCWSSLGNHYINPIAVRGGYEVTSGGCGDNYSLSGYRFNFGTIGGYNVPTFFVDHQGDCGNHKTVNLEYTSNMVEDRLCWSAHETQVWDWPTLDPDKDVSKCIYY